MKSLTGIISILLLVHCSGTKELSKELTTKSGVKYTVLKTGVGEAAKAGQQVTIYESMGYLSG